MKAGLVNMPIAPSLVKTLDNQARESDPAAGGFGQFLKQALGEVNKLQHEAEQTAAKVVTGEIEDIHQAVLAAEKAMLSLQLTIQVRNKVLEAYQEIIRMPV